MFQYYFATAKLGRSFLRYNMFTYDVVLPEHLDTFFLLKIFIKILPVYNTM